MQELALTPDLVGYAATLDTPAPWNRRIAMLRPALVMTFVLSLALAPAVAGPASPAAGTLPDESHEAIAMRCFGLQSSDPAAAVALAESTLSRGGVPVEPEIKLLVCLARASALAGEAERVDAAVARIDRLLAHNTLPPEFLLRALSNAGAALHTVGRIHEALDFYARAFEVATEDESSIAQVTTLINVGEIHGAELGAYEEAEAYFARAEAIERGAGLGDPLLAYNRGINFLRLGRETDALAAFTDAEPKANKPTHAMVLRRIRAELIALRGSDADLADTRAALQAAAAEQRAQDDPAGAALTLIRLSDLERKKGQPEAALEHALAAKAAVAGGVFHIEHRDALQAEVAARVALQQWPQAFAGSEALRRLDNDRLLGQQLAGLASLQARLQDARSAESLAILQQEREREAHGLQQARRLRNGAIAAFCVLALLGGAFLVYQRRVNRKLERLSTIDSLTGLLNRRAGEAALAELPLAVGDGDQRCVTYLIDVDRFKDYNDHFGHAVGDTILASIAARLRAACRPSDIVTRWGGEEFVVVCQGLDSARAAIVAERLREAVHAAQSNLRDHAPPTVSIGFACLPFLPDAARRGGWQESVTLADRALYAAKHSGRNAWVGLWGAAGSTAALAAVLADPQAHAKTGDLTVLAEHQNVEWPPPQA